MRSPSRLIAFVALLTLAGCGSPASLAAKSEGALSLAAQATNQARDAFVRWDRAHELALAAHAGTTEAETRAILAAYEAGPQAKVLHAFAVAYSAIAAAAAIIPLVDAGHRTPLELIGLVTRAAGEVTQLRDALALLGVAP